MKKTKKEKRDKIILNDLGNIMKRSILIALILILIVFLMYCSLDKEISEQYSIKPIELNDGWKISSPDEHNMNKNELIEAYKYASTLPFMYSVLIIKDDYIIAEKYFNGAGIYQAKYIASATKSYLSALIGIAIDKGYIINVEEKMMSFFPEYDSYTVEVEKYEITIKHLLQMTAGYWADSTDERWWTWINSPDWIKYMIDLPLESSPGAKWTYSTGSSQILSGILTKATGMSGTDFAIKYLLDPINSDLVRWDKDPQGYNHGGFNMYHTPRDMARLGLLYLHKGRFNGKQIVSENWIRESTKPLNRVSWSFGPIIKASYGYHWWSGEIRDYSCIFATGHGGQNIMIFKDLNMVVVTTTNSGLGWAAGWTQSVISFYYIANYIIPSIID